MSPPRINFFTKPREVKDGKFYKPPSEEQELIAKFINAGYVPVINSVEPAKECGSTAISLATCHSTEFLVYKGGPAFCIIFWTTITQDELKFAQGHFNRFIGVGNSKRALVPWCYKDNARYKVHYYGDSDSDSEESESPDCISTKAPNPQLAGSEPVKYVDQENRVVSRIIGGERADEVTRMLKELQVIADRLDKLQSKGKYTKFQYSVEERLKTDWSDKGPTRTIRVGKEENGFKFAGKDERHPFYMDIPRPPNDWFVEGVDEKLDDPTLGGQD
jgi:hypothetical protein